MKSGQVTSAKLSATDRVRLTTLQLVMDEHRIRVGANIRARREELGWSVPTTARKIPVADKTLERWERGETFGHMKNLEKLAEVLQTTVATLMVDAEDEPATETPDLLGQFTDQPADAPEWATRLFHELDEKLDHVIGRLDALAAQLPGEEEQPTGRAAA